MGFYAAVLLAVALCGVGARAAGNTVPDATLQDAIAQAMQTVLNGPMMGSAKLAMGGMQAGLSNLHGSMSTAYAAAGAQAEAALAAYEAQYCTPAEFTPSEKKPATFTGHSMAVTFSMGGCTFDEKKWIQDDIKELNCTEPSISYEKAPANFTSKRHTAPSFTSKECKITKTFGESVEKVLFVFDGQQAPDINSLTAKITEEVKNILGTVQNGAKDLFSGVKGATGNLLNGGGAVGAAPGFIFS